jgi:hypothetical protein
MPIFRETNQISKIFRGTTEIVKAFRGEDLIFQLGGDVYELIADVDVTSNTTQIDFTALNITKDDEYKMVYTLVGDTTSTADYDLRVNDITSNYVYQQLNGSGTSVSAGRVTTARFAYARSNRRVSGFIDIKVSNNDRYVAQSQWVDRIGADSSTIQQLNWNIVNTSTVTSITKISIISSRTGGLAVGSRLTLYKVVK